jgi:hypothetical protein
MTIVTHYNQLSYTLGNGTVDVQVSIQGGHITARFKPSGQLIEPFAVAPWWNESIHSDEPLTNVLRGCFFCLPAGLASEYRGVRYPTHGETANGIWNYISEEDADGVRRLSLMTQTGSDRISIRKNITIKEGHPVIYLQDVVSRAAGKYPVGYHPTLQLPADIGSSRVDFSMPVFASTSPTHIEDPAQGGYSLLKENHPITDFTRVPTCTGTTVNVLKVPFTRGYEDIFMLASDETKDFCYVAVTVPSKGYVYFQLKNPRKLTGTMFWTSNAGRHYAPWSGRSHGIMSINEVCSNYYYGMAGAEQPGFIGPTRCRTYHSFDQALQPFELILGAAPTPAGFEGVADIVPAGNQKVHIIGIRDEVIEVNCDLSFIGEPGVYKSLINT